MANVLKQLMGRDQMKRLKGLSRRFVKSQCQKKETVLKLIQLFRGVHYEIMAHDELNE